MPNANALFAPVSGRRWEAGLLAALMALAAPVPMAAAETRFPGKDWETIDPKKAGWSLSRLKQAEKIAAELGTTAVMIVDGGRVVATWGDVAEPVRVASIRKSFLSALYGIAVSEHRIDLSKTLKDLGIDDKRPKLTEEEKKATIRDLIRGRSGVYHLAASETIKMKERRPERGSHPHDTCWMYNNWDFNALGTIYRQLTGEDIFEGVEKRIARPIGMQDFSAADGKYVMGRDSLHPAYHMDFTARDLARFGWLYLNKGRWQDKHVVPADWVAESTKAHSHADTHKATGYGYMWWVAEKDVHRSARAGQGAFSARGYGGQFILVAPAHDVVVVLLHANHITNPQEGRLLKAIMEAAPRNWRH